jgi:hypothetical protein
MTLNRLNDSLQPLPSPDVQRTTLSLDLMGRFVCDTWEEAVGNGGAPFDVVIIGAGMFGGYCADVIFRKSSLRVLVLDAGPFVAATHFQNMPNVALFAPGPIDPASPQPGMGNALAGRLSVRGPSFTASAGNRSSGADGARRSWRTTSRNGPHSRRRLRSTCGTTMRCSSARSAFATAKGTLRRTILRDRCSTR